MASVLIRHKVRDYDSWKKVFDDFVQTRKQGGERSYQIWRIEGDANNLVLLFEWSSVEEARKFLDSQALKDAMKKSGVIDTPDIYFLNEAAHGSTTETVSAGRSLEFQ